MNTERVNTLKMLRTARKALEKVLDGLADDHPNRKPVQKLIDAFEDAEDLLFVKDLRKNVTMLRNASAKLKNLNKKIKQDTQKLRSAAEKAKAAATAVGVLADIASKASLLG